MSHDPAKLDPRTHLPVALRQLAAHDEPGAHLVLDPSTGEIRLAPRSTEVPPPDGVVIDSIAEDGFFAPAAQSSAESRLAAEIAWLAPYFPQFRWYRWNGEVFAEGPLRTNRGSTYAVRVILPHDYPSGIPLAVITHPKPVFDARGRALVSHGLSAPMHLLEPHEGMPVICHYPAWTWTPARTVYQVVVKARLWLEAFDLHLATRLPLDTWLGHAPS